MSKHSKLPWRWNKGRRNLQDGEGSNIGMFMSDNDIEYLLKAVNNYDKLINLLKVSKCRDCNDTGMIRTRVYGGVDYNQCRWCQEKSEALDAAKEA